MTDVEMARQAVGRWKATAEALARDIWSYAELPYCETKSAAALCGALEREGFSVETHVAGIPTCFTAVFRNGTGTPVVGLLAEFDALDGLSQRAAWPEREAVTPGGAGHGCGHNLLGAGCFAAAMAIRDCLVQEGLDGSVVFFGCPAEEGAGSKQFMARAGCFDGIDFALTWHPGTWNQVPAKRNVAIMGGNFTFDGVAAHAGGAPHLGRSALDAAELMNVGVNYLREHMPDEARVHYAYADAGGTAPNVVPAHAVIKYEVRAPTVDQVQELFERVVNVAQGAALMTQTQMRWEITMAFSDYVPNRTLAEVVDQCLWEIGAPVWTEADYRLAAQFLQTSPEPTRREMARALEPFLTGEELANWERQPLDSRVHPFDAKECGCVSGSTDVGDAACAVPTVMLTVATACLGNVGHSWQNTAFSCSPIGLKGMGTAAEALTLSALRLLQRPDLLQRAEGERAAQHGERYRCPLPEDVKPPVGRY